MYIEQFIICAQVEIAIHIPFNIKWSLIKFKFTLLILLVVFGIGFWAICVREFGNRRIKYRININCGFIKASFSDWIFRTIRILVLCTSVFEFTERNV